MRHSKNFQRQFHRWRAIGWSAILAFVACSPEAPTTKPNPIGTILVTLASGQIMIGVQTKATAEARDANGAVISGQTPTWSTSDPTVATVSSVGMVTGMKTGSASIIATIDKTSGSAEVIVATPPAAQVAIMQQPSATAYSGVALAQQPIVQLRDGNGG